MNTLSQAIEQTGIDPDAIEIQAQMKLVWHRPFDSISGPCHEFVSMPAWLTLSGPADATGNRPTLLRLDNSATAVYPGEAEPATQAESDKLKRPFDARGNDAFWGKFTTVSGPLNELAGPQGIARTDLQRLVYDLLTNKPALDGTLGLSPILFEDRHPVELVGRESKELVTLNYGRLLRYVAADEALFDVICDNDDGAHYDTEPYKAALYERNRLTRLFIEQDCERPTFDLLLAASRKEDRSPFGEFASWFWRSEEKLIDRSQQPAALRVTRPRVSVEGRHSIVELVERCKPHYEDKTDAEFAKALGDTVCRALQVHPLHRELAYATAAEVVMKMRCTAPAEATAEAAIEEVKEAPKRRRPKAP